MARTNAKTKGSSVDKTVLLAGGMGAYAAKQTSEQTLRRLVNSCLLWEDCAYIDGESVVKAIQAEVPKVSPEIVAQMAIDARYEQKLRHVPLLLVREMARHTSHRGHVANTLARVCKRPDETCEFLSLYWGDNGGKRALPRQVKKGLASALCRYDEYQMAKWACNKRSVKLRDVLQLSHPRPANQEMADLFRRLDKGELKTPDTWEVGLSAAKTENEKKEVWERLITEGKLGALALLKNIRNMEQVKVSRKIIQQAFRDCRPDMLLPIDFLRAHRNTTEWSREIEDLMYRCAATWPKLQGHTIMAIDVSGSMNCPLSDKTDYKRYEVAAALAVLAAECCEHVSVYATSGDYHTHMARKVPTVRGFALADKIGEAANKLPGGGIFTRQLCEYLREKEKEAPERIIVFSDSQDCEHSNRSLPRPHGHRNYIIDVSSHTHGVNYKGVWTAELSGWSESFLRFIATLEQSS